MSEQDHQTGGGGVTADNVNLVSRSHHGELPLTHIEAGGLAWLHSPHLTHQQGRPLGQTREGSQNVCGLLWQEEQEEKGGELFL